MNQSEEPLSIAEDLFADFLDRTEQGDPADFAALLAEHPEQADVLTRMHHRWSAMSTAFSVLASASTKTTEQSRSPSMDALLARIGAETGRFARYAVGSEIARGAMGRVVSAWDGDLGREVALKIQRADDTDTRRRRRFLEEAQIAGQLDHPGIVPIHELGVDPDGRPFFAMKLVRGRHLGEVIRAAREGRDGWSQTRALHVLLRVCEAIAYAHDRGVVHRDLKPENVMVGRFGETYVMDWGLAVVGSRPDESRQEPEAPHTLRAAIAAEDASSPLLTRHGDVVGTPAYMAPEQASGATGGPLHAIDIHALGAILYHICSGRMPYVAEGETPNAAEVLRRVAEAQLAPLPPDVSPELRAIQERAMARDPQQRYPSVEALADDLRAYLELRVVKAYATGPIAELRKWMARNRGVSIAIACAALALIVGTVISTDAWLSAERARRSADDSARRLTAELGRSEFRNARLLLRSDNAAPAEDKLWSQHFDGVMPRATHWALAEMYERTPCAATVDASTRANVPVRFVPGRHEIVVGSDDGNVRILDDARLGTIASVRVGDAAVQSLVVSRGGDRVYAGLADGTLAVFDPSSRELIGTAHAHSDNLRYVAVAHDGTRFATGGGDGRVLLWEHGLEAPRELTRHDAAIWSLCFGDDDRLLFSGDEKGGLRSSELAGDTVRKWRLGNRNVMAIAALDHAERIWAGSADQYIYIVDTTVANGVRSIWTRNGTCRDIVRDVDDTLIVGGWWRIDRFNQDGTPLQPVGLNGTWRFDLDRTTHRLVSAGDRAAVRVFDLAGRGTVTLGGMNVALSGDGKKVAFDTETSVVVRSLDEHDGSEDVVLPGFGGWLALDRTGSRIATFARARRALEVHDLHAPIGAPAFIIGDAKFGNSNEWFAFSPDGSELATFVGGDALRRVGSADGHLIAEHREPGAVWVRLRYTRDGKRLAVLSLRPPQLMLVTLADGSVENIALPPLPTVAALSADGRLVAVADRDGVITIDDRVSGKRRVVGVRSGTVWSLDFSPVDSGLLIASTRADGVTFLDLDSGEVCHRWAVDDGPITQLQISDDGQSIAGYSQRGAVLHQLSALERYIAGNLEFQLARLRESVHLDPVRETELRSWARTQLDRAARHPR